MNYGVGQRLMTLKSNRQAVQGFPVNRFYTKAEADDRFARIGTGSLTLGDPVIFGTPYANLYVDGSGNLANGFLLFDPLGGVSVDIENRYLDDADSVPVFQFMSLAGDLVWGDVAGFGNVSQAILSDQNGQFTFKTSISGTRGSFLDVNTAEKSIFLGDKRAVLQGDMGLFQMLPYSSGSRHSGWEAGIIDPITSNPYFGIIRSQNTGFGTTVNNTYLFGDTNSIAQGGTGLGFILNDGTSGFRGTRVGYWGDTNSEFHRLLWTMDDADSIAKLGGLTTGTPANPIPTYTGSGGLDDMTLSGTYTGNSSATYTVGIDGINTCTISYSGKVITGADFSPGQTITNGLGVSGEIISDDGVSELKISNVTGGVFSPTNTIDNGVGCTATVGSVTPLVDQFSWTDGLATMSNVNITGSAQLLNNGAFITFGATVGHQISPPDGWTWAYSISYGDMAHFDGDNQVIEIGDLGGIISPTKITLDIGGQTYAINAPNGTFISQLAGSGAGYVGVDNAGLLTFNSSIPFSAIGSTPTTLSGYGITDAQTEMYSGSFSQAVTAVATFTVTIGVTMASAAYQVNVTPTALLSAALFYVTNKTTTTFDVVFLSALTGTVTFDWIVKP